MNIDQFFRSFYQGCCGVLILDFDGTIAPFHKEPQKVAIYPQIAELLELIMQETKTRVVIVSGRCIEDLLPLCTLFPLPELWGTHGLECLLPSGRYFRRAVSAKQREGLCLARQLLDGVAHRIEEKPKQDPASLAVHWRGESAYVIQKIRRKLTHPWEELAQKFDLRCLCFNGGIELRAHEINKGIAIDYILHDDHNEKKPIAYLGDDITDEDAFRALKSRGLKVLVGRKKRDSLADVTISTPKGVVRFLINWRRACV